MDKVKILLAEDGEVHARILIAVLEKAGFEITHVGSGTEAYDAIKKQNFDLLITDIMMPGMSGFELMSRLKIENGLPPTVVLTAKQDEVDVLRGLELGALDYVSKPISPGIILAKVKKALAQRIAA